MFEKILSKFKRKKRSKLDRKENIVAFLFILIPLIGFFVFTFLSICFSFYLSFNDYNLLREEFTWIGLDNYTALFKTDGKYYTEFIRSIGNTFIFMLSMPIGMILGLLLAVLLTSKSSKHSKLHRTLIYLPTVASAVAINIIWRYFFTNDANFAENRGIINSFFGISVNWLSEPTPMRLGIIIKNVINGVGAMMILYYAGLMNVPRDYYEAAEIDGASGLQKFYHITLPMLSPITFYILITGVIGGLQSYTDSAVFANGSIYARTIVYFIWNWGINSHKYGIASAASVLLSITIMTITIIQFKTSDRWVKTN